MSNKPNITEDAEDKLIRIYEPHILCSECSLFFANWKLLTNGKYYCDTCVEEITLDDLDALSSGSVYITDGPESWN